jgi:hypothetical protein
MKKSIAAILIAGGLLLPGPAHAIELEFCHDMGNIARLVAKARDDGTSLTSALALAKTQSVPVLQGYNIAIVSAVYRNPNLSGETVDRATYEFCIWQQWYAEARGEK